MTVQMGKADDSRIEFLQKENEKLREMIRILQEENRRLRGMEGNAQGIVDKYALKLAAALSRIGGTVPSGIGRCRTMSEMKSSKSESVGGKLWEGGSVEVLLEEVVKHKAFIQHLKASLQELLEERVRERQEHLLTKSRLEALQRTLEESCR